MLTPFEAPGEHGFTLVELVVAIAIGIVVSLALFSILDFTWRQTTAAITNVDATASGRVALAKIEQELESACLTSGVTPPQPGSSGTTLLFLSAYGKAAQPTPVEHAITYSSATNSVSDSLYAVSGGAAPDWTFSSAPYASTVLLTDVQQSGTTPVFQYFSYQEVPNGSGGYYTDGQGNAYMMLLDGTSSVPGTTPAVIPVASPLSDPAPGGLSATAAAGAAEVLITLSVGAGGGTLENTNLSDSRLTITDSVVLRLTPPPNTLASGAAFGPCE